MLHDADIREPLFDYLEASYGKIRILEEVEIARSRADVIMVTDDSLVGLEIKSDADTYVRLERQVKDYNLFFDYNYVVVGSTHAKHVNEHIPDSWGIISAELIDGNMDFYVLREPTRNKRQRIKRKLSLLWRPELAHIQERNELPKYKQKSKDFVVNKLIEKLTREQLDLEISTELFERDYTLIADIIANYKKENQKPVKKRRSRKAKKITRKHV